MGAWLYRNYQVADRLVFTTRPGWGLVYENEYFQAFTRGEVGSEEEWTQAFPKFPTEIERFDYLRSRAKKYILQHPFEYVGLCIKRMVSLVLPSQVKSLIYKTLKKPDVRDFKMPFWPQISNAVFLMFFWLLTIPSAYLFFRKRGLHLAFLFSPAGLLLLFVLGQILVYALFAYIEYQRTIIDLEIILLGAWFLTNGEKSQDAESKRIEPALT